MKLKVNDKEVESGATSLLQLTEELTLRSTGVAVAVNNRMIPRTDWANHLLNEGDAVVIIKAACGG